MTRLKTADERKAEFMAELSALCLKFGGAEIYGIVRIKVHLPTQYDGNDNVTAEGGSFLFGSCDAHWKPKEEQA